MIAECLLWVRHHYSLLVQTAAAAGTFIIAVLAIWGPGIIARLAGPKLRLRLEVPEGTLPISLSTVRLPSGEYVPSEPPIVAKYYHLKVSNLRPHVLAKRVGVFLIEIRRQGPDGEMYCDRALSAPLQLNYQWAKQPNNPNFHDASPTIGPSHRLADLGRIIRDQTFELTTYARPNNLNLRLMAGQRLQILVRAEAENALSNELLINIDWDGQWHEGLDEMARHLIVCAKEI